MVGGGWWMVGERVWGGVRWRGVGYGDVPCAKACQVPRWPHQDDWYVAGAVVVSAVRVERASLLPSSLLSGPAWGDGLERGSVISVSFKRALSEL